MPNGSRGLCPSPRAYGSVPCLESLRHHASRRRRIFCLPAIPAIPGVAPMQISVSATCRDVGASVDWRQLVASPFGTAMATRALQGSRHFSYDVRPNKVIGGWLVFYRRRFLISNDIPPSGAVTCHKTLRIFTSSLVYPCFIFRSAFSYLRMSISGYSNYASAYTRLLK